MNPIELSICVLHFNRWDLTKDCLASIDAQEIPCSHEKILVDNGSTADRYHGVSGDWRLVRYEENRGHIVGQNRCFASAQGEWVLFVANDVRLMPGCIQTLWMCLRPRIIKFPSLYTLNRQPDNRGMQWIWPGYGVSNWHEWEPFGFNGSCYLMEKREWEKAGRFDEQLVTSHEDIDLSLRLRQLGVEMYACMNNAVALHLGNATLRHQPSHNRAAFHRDRLYVLRKHYRGLDYWTRYVAVQLLDHLPRFS